jgi:hypothetical protein
VDAQLVGSLLVSTQPNRESHYQWFGQFWAFSDL